MTEKFETYAYFWINGAFTTSEITDIIGLFPTEVHEKGDAKKYRPAKAWEESWWKFHSPLRRDEIFIDAHISALLELLESKKDVIEKLQSKYETGISCVGYYTDAHPGFHMNEKMIQSLANLKLSVDFDLYCLCDHDEAEERSNQEET